MPRHTCAFGSIGATTETANAYVAVDVDKYVFARDYLRIISRAQSSAVVVVIISLSSERYAAVFAGILCWHGISIELKILPAYGVPSNMSYLY